MPDSVGRFLRSTELTVIGNDATSFTVEPPLEIDPRDYVVAVRFWLSDPHRTTPWVVDPESVAVSADDVTVTLSTAYFNTGKLVRPERNDTLSGFTSRGGASGGGGLKPDISAPGQSIFSVASGTGNGGQSLNGTSMAAPHMAGVLALLRQQNPTWTVEQIKALAMNTAGHDLYTGTNGSGTAYGPARVGSGGASSRRCSG